MEEDEVARLKKEVARLEKALGNMRLVTAVTRPN
jgi:hypothetical protein